jgi:hypothetical protein
MFITDGDSSSADIRSMLRRVASRLLAMTGYTRPPGCDGDFNTDGDVSRHDVLIFSTDPLAAALLGAAVELAGHTPHFPKAGEAARAALMRLRPSAVLIDCDHDEACAESFVGPALMTGAKVQLFASRRTRHDASDMARRLGLTIVELPMEPDAFASLLHDLSGTTT